MDWRISLRVAQLYDKIHPIANYSTANALSDSTSMAASSLIGGGAEQVPTDSDADAGVDVTIAALLRRAGRLNIEDLRGLTPFPLDNIKASLARLERAGYIRVGGDSAIEIVQSKRSRIGRRKSAA